MFDWVDLLGTPSVDKRSGTLPAGWQGRNLSATDALDGTSRATYKGRPSLRMTGVAGVTKQLTQTIHVSGAAGSLFVFEAVSKAAGTSPKGGAYQIEVRIVFTDGTSRAFPVTFTKGTHDWERFGISFPAPSAFKEVIISITYANQTGIVWFNGLHLWTGHQSP